MKIARIVQACVFASTAALASWARAACNPGLNQVAVFTGTNFAGACKILNVGRYDNSTQMGIANDSISSVKVGDGARALLFEHANFGGRQAFYEGGYDYGNVGSAVNDRTSSILVSSRTSDAAFWYLGNNPSGLETSWASDVQGIASSEYDAWLITNTTSILKFPIDRIAGSNALAQVGIPPELASRGCDHFGDPDALAGYLFVPVEGCADGPMVAVFDANSLDLICYDSLYRQGKAAWVALDVEGNLASSGGDINATSPILTYVIDWNAIYPDPEPHWFLYDGPQNTLKNHDGVPLSFSWMQGGDFNEDGTLLYLSNGGPACEGGDTGLRIVDTSSYTQIAHSGNAYGPFNYQHSCDVFASEEAEGLDYRDMTGIGASFEGTLHALLLDNDAVTSRDDVYLKHYAK